MTGLTVFRFVLETLVVLAISYGFYREENIVKFERKVFRFIKRAVKITVNEIRESRKSKTNVDNIVELRSEDDVEAQYDYLLKKVG
jgi:hypothetical protein